VLLFLAWTAEVPGDTTLYCGLWRSPLSFFAPLFVTLPGVNLWTWQVLLFALAPLCVLRPGAFRRRAWVMDVAILVSLASVGVTFVWGLARGGSAYQAYYQLWRFLAALLVGLLLMSVLRTSRDLRALGTTLVTAALVRATLALYFYFAHVRGRDLSPYPTYMTNHDDSLLWIAAMLVAGAWAIERWRRSTWILTALAVGYLIAAIIVNARRLAWVELGFVALFGYMLLPRGRVRRRVNRALLVAAPVLALYVAVGWGRAGFIFEPIRALSTSGSDADSSSLARLEEMRNLMYTLVTFGNPIVGVGWGQPYYKVTSLYANFGVEWWQYLYLPHNSLMGVAVFGGLVGLFGIWLVVPVTAFLGMRGYRLSLHPRARAGAMAAVAILPAYGVQCYGDVGFQSLTGGLILGAAIGVAGKVSAWAARPEGAQRPRRIDRRPSRQEGAPAAAVGAGE
jgi:hypothetical protein